MSDHDYRTMKLPVSDAKNKALAERMLANEIYEDDLEESFVHSSGPGGQHVNKTATCVKLRHRITGIAVSCQRTRSQGLNRYYARKMMCEELENRTLGKASPANKEVSKAKKQKDRRRRRAVKKRLSDCE